MSRMTDALHNQNPGRQQFDLISEASLRYKREPTGLGCIWIPASSIPALLDENVDRVRERERKFIDFQFGI